MSFNYERPESQDELLNLLENGPPELRLLAGGTDLLVGIRHRVVRTPLVIDLKFLKDLVPVVHQDRQHLTIAATTTISQIIEEGSVGKYFPALNEALHEVGSIQVRNRATLIGNLCNASPAADTVPPLLIYGALVNVVGRQGSREIPIGEFILGPRQTVLRHGEFVVSLRLPLPEGPLGASFTRLTRRRGVDLATINLCCSIDDAGTVKFAYGAVGPRAFLVIDKSGVLADPSSPASAKDAALAKVAGDATPITDLRATLEYRKAMLLIMSRRILQIATSRLIEGRADA